MDNYQQLKLLNLPVFANMEELSSLTHISFKTIFGIYYNAYSFYRRMNIYKKNGKIREIHIPNKNVKALQAWVLRMILDKIIPSSHATAFRKNYSIINHVTPHKYNRYFLLIDIKDFFPSIERKRICFLFQTIGYNEKQSKILSRICTCGNFLPQGGITSPAIANLIVNRLDRRVSSLCIQKNIIYTRYADDLTFSSNNRNILNNTKEILLKIIENESFTPNIKKTHFMGPKIRCSITGLVKNSSEPIFGIGKTKKNKMRAVIFNSIVNNKFLITKYQTLDSIKGWLIYCRNIDENSYQYFRRYILHLNPTNNIYLLKKY